MNKKGLKFALALFLVGVCIITPLLIKKNVRAQEIQYPKNLAIKGLSYGPTSDNLQGNMGGNLKDIERVGLMFNVNLSTINTLLPDYIWFEYTYTLSTQKMSLFAYRNSDYSGNVMFTLEFYYMGNRNIGLWRFNGLETEESIVIQYKYQIIEEFNNGFNIEVGYPIDNYTYTSNIIDTTSETYLVLTCFNQEEEEEDITPQIQQAYESGQQSVIDNPNAFDLYTPEQMQEEVEYEWNDGYRQGKLDGIAEGGETPNSFRFNEILTSVFNSAGAVLNTEILGKLKLIHLIAIPLLLTLLAIILKILRG